MMAPINVSIIIPVYNAVEYIKRCLDSVAAQIYPNIECVLVDDCSTDKSVEIIEAYIATYTGTVSFKLYALSEINKGPSGGPSTARNFGLKKATGEYVYFLDGDDDITADCISDSMQFVEKYSSVDLVQGNIVLTNVNSERLLSLNISDIDLPEYSSDRLWIKKALLTLLPCTAWGKLIKKDLLIKNNLWFKEGIIHEDDHWRFFLSKYVQTIAITKTPTYKYYVNENSLMTTRDRTKSYLDVLLIVEDCLLYVDPLLENMQSTHLLRLLLSRRLGALVDLKDRTVYDKAYAQFVKRVCKTNARFFVKVAITYLRLPSKWLKNVLFMRYFGLWMRLYDRFGPDGLHK